MLHYFITSCYLICMHVPILCLAVVEVLCGPCGGAGRGPRSCVSGKLMAQALAAAAFLGVVKRRISPCHGHFQSGDVCCGRSHGVYAALAILPSRVMIDIFTNTDSYHILSILGPLLIFPLFSALEKVEFLS